MRAMRTAPALFGFGVAAGNHPAQASDILYRIGAELFAQGVNEIFHGIAVGFFANGINAVFKRAARKNGARAGEEG